MEKQSDSITVFVEENGLGCYKLHINLGRQDNYYEEKNN